MQRILLLLGGSLLALSALVVGLTFARTSVPAALTVMVLFAVMAIGVIVLIVRRALRPQPTPRPARQPHDDTHQTAR